MKMFTICTNKCKNHRSMLKAELAAARPREAICYMVTPDRYTIYTFEGVIGEYNIWCTVINTPSLYHKGRTRYKRQVRPIKHPAGCTTFTDIIIREWQQHYRGGIDYVIGRDT